MTQFEQSDWLRSENIINIMITLLTHNTWYSNLNNRPQCVIKSKKQTNADREPGGDTFHVISSTFHGRLKMKGYQFQVQL